MKRKSFFYVAIVATLLFAACEPKEPDNNSPKKIGVEMYGGVVWAPYNVGATGTFVANIEDYGGLFQWNRKDTANFFLFDAYYASDYSIATFWSSAPENNPCPKGWRVPRTEEIDCLYDTDGIEHEWTKEKGVYGNRFTDKESFKSIFLPAAGWRDAVDGTVHDAGEEGNYWSSTQSRGNDTDVALYLLFHISDTWFGATYKSYGLSVRCVAE